MCAMRLPCAGMLTSVSVDIGSGQPPILLRSSNWTTCGRQQGRCCVVMHAVAKAY